VRGEIGEKVRVGEMSEREKRKRQEKEEISVAAP